MSICHVLAFQHLNAICKGTITHHGTWEDSVSHYWRAGDKILNSLSLLSLAANAWICVLASDVLPRTVNSKRGMQTSSYKIIFWDGALRTLTVTVGAVTQSATPGALPWVDFLIFGALYHMFCEFNSTISLMKLWSTLYFSNKLLFA